MASENNEPSHNEEPKEDLDAFLIELESKLRAPFSSLDLAKAVAATALRTSSPQRYLQLVSKVLPKMDKVIQLRVLVGLLGLETSVNTDNVVYTDILSRLQESSTHEEWVRIVAGLVRGIMFYDPENDEGCRGEEAKSLLKDTCKDIVQRVQNHETETDKKENDASLLWTAEMDPLFLPYRYSLVNSKLLQHVVPECHSNPHFQINQDADILCLDKKMENAKAEEEKREQAQKRARSKMPGNTPVSKPASRPDLQGKPQVASKSVTSRPTTVTGKPKPSAPKSSMFIQSKKPAMGSHGRLGRQLVNMRKNAVHARRPGSAQALVAKSRRPGGLPGAAASSLRRGNEGGGGSVGRAMKYGHNKSKMKMIDVAEVQGLTKEHKEREDKDTKEQKMSARKRKILESAKGLKKQKPNESNGPAETAPVPPPAQSKNSQEALASAALLAYQQQMTSIGTNESPSERDGSVKSTENPTVAQVGAPVKQDWQQLLEKSNKLSDDDKLRVKRFFMDRFNPTPDIPVYKMKLHEEKTADPSGQTVKETLYLELDYNTFGFKKLRKIKKK